MSAPTATLEFAFDSFRQTLEAVTVPMTAGMGRRIPDREGAIALSEATRLLHNALGAEYQRLFDDHGRREDPRVSPIQLEASDSLEGPWLQVPPSEMTSQVMAIGGSGADAVLLAAIQRAVIATAFPAETACVDTRTKPSSVKDRFRAGEEISADTLESLDSVSRLLALRRSVEAPTIAVKRKGRVKREVANPLIAEHLCRRSHDTVQEVAKAIGCSTGLVSESPGWRANQARLKDAKSRGCDPIALPLADYLSMAGGNQQRQLHAHKAEQSARDAETDRAEIELYRKIGEYQVNHQDASTAQVAKAVGCTARDVEQRQATLDRLAAEQAESLREEGELPSGETRPQMRVRKRA